MASQKTILDPQLHSKKKTRIILFSILGIGFLTRFIYYLSAKNALWFTQPMVDSLNYHLWAQAILTGDFLGQGIWVHSPLYAFFLAGLYKVLGATIPAQAATIQLLLLGPLGCLAIYFLGKQFFSQTIGLLAGLGAALYGPALFFEGNLLTTQLIHLLNIALLLSAYWASKQSRAIAWALPGLLLGLSALTRPNIILMLPIFMLWMWIQTGSWQHWKKIIRPTIWLTLITFIVLSPAVLRNKIVLDEWMLSVGNGGLNFYLGNYEKATGYHIPMGELGLSAAEQVTRAKIQAETISQKKLTYGESSRFWWQQAFKTMTAHPWRAIRLFSKKIALTFNQFEYTTSLNYNFVQKQSGVLKWPWLSFGVLVCFSFMGMLLSFKKWRSLFPLYGLILIYTFSNVLLLVSAEYRYAFLPAMLLFASVAVQHLFLLFQEKQWRPLSFWGIQFIFLAGLVYFPLIPKSVQQYHLATASNNIGATYAKLGQFSQAIQAFKTALGDLEKLSEYQPSLQLQLGKAYLNINQPAVAFPYLASAFSAMPKNPDAGNSLANALTGLSQFSHALEIRKQVLALDQTNPEYWVNLGITYLWMEQPALAEPAFKKAMQIDPSIANKLDATKQNIQHYILQRHMNTK